VLAFGPEGLFDSCCRSVPGLWLNADNRMVAGPSQRSPGIALETLASERGRCVFLAYKNITIAVWTGQADLAAAQATERAARIMAARYRAGRSVVSFILDGVPGPTPEAGELLTRLMGQRESLACIAYVLEGSGFWASGLRSMITNAYRESGTASRLKIGTNADEIASWLSASHQHITGVAISQADLQQALQQARRLDDSGQPPQSGD
jgi:hypothetical protein